MTQNPIKESNSKRSTFATQNSLHLSCDPQWRIPVGRRSSSSFPSYAKFSSLFFKNVMSLSIADSETVVGRGSICGASSDPGGMSPETSWSWSSSVQSWNNAWSFVLKRETMGRDSSAEVVMVGRVSFSAISCYVYISVTSKYRVGAPQYLS